MKERYWVVALITIAVTLLVNVWIYGVKGLLGWGSASVDTERPVTNKQLDTEWMMWRGAIQSGMQQQQSIQYTLKSFEDALVDTVGRVKQSVVSIVITKDLASYRANAPMRFGSENLPQKTVVGGWSGIFVHKDGYVITNKHVVEDPDAQYSVIFSDGRTVTWQQVRMDPVLDIAVIRISDIGEVASIEPATIISRDDEVNVWQFAIAIGNALAEYQNSVTLGIISGRNRSLGSQNRNLYAWLYQTDTPINQWNSGWPLLDINGRVIWINTAISAEWSNIGFAIPITQQFVDATIKSIQTYNTISRPFIGIQYADLNPQVAQELKVVQTKWVYVAEVVDKTAAAIAGIKKNDVVTAINGKIIDDEYPFLYQLYTFAPGDTVKLTIIRDGMPKEVEISLWKNDGTP